MELVSFVVVVVVVIIIIIIISSSSSSICHPTSCMQNRSVSPTHFNQQEVYTVRPSYIYTTYNISPLYSFWWKT